MIVGRFRLGMRTLKTAIAVMPVSYTHLKNNNSSLFSSNFTSISVIIKEKSYLGANIYDSGSISFRHANVKNSNCCH
ncbi:hypothetical protein, partial [Enterococcus faecalis]|uniref:hypothetical protein n=1 Tax=Enterococcus faecalis TaxID=1351 RepID=UPI0011788EF2